MALLLLLFFASAVLTIMFWATAAAVALAILQGIFWLITRPIVWLVIMPLQYILGGSQKPSPGPQQASLRAINPAAASSTDKLQHLAKLKALLDSGALSQSEFERLKSELLAN